MEIIRAAIAAQHTKASIRSGENGEKLEATLNQISHEIEVRSAQGWNFLTYKGCLKFEPTVTSILRSLGYIVTTWIGSENPDNCYYKIEWPINE